MPDRDWLDSLHPIYAAHRDDWKRDEVRFHGGPAVLGELRRFEQNDTHYRARQLEALHLNHMHATATTFVGHLLREFPEPGQGLHFGGLGEVTRERGGAPTAAELLYYNADGAGADGQQMAGFLAAAVRRAMMGHRWIFVEAPASSPRTRRDELEGARPYWVELSPLDVTNWHYGRDGVLEFAVMRVSERDPRLEDGQFVGNANEPGYYLHVRAGFRGLGDEFAAGGWWRFDGDRRPITGASGDYARTGGQIPLVCLYGEKAMGTRARPAMSRSLLWGIGQADVALMNAMSVRAFDAWDAARSVQYIAGIDATGWELANKLTAEGSQRIPLIAPQRGDGSLGAAPTVIDGSLGAVPAEVFEKLIASITTQIDRLASNIATSAPESSGMSKRVGFAEGMSPRLANMAENAETAINSLLHFTELRWGVARPSAYVTLPRQFDLAPLVDDLDAMFSTLRDSGLRSPTLEVGMTVAAARARRALADDDVEAVTAELRQSAEDAAQTGENAQSLEREMAAATERERAARGAVPPVEAAPLEAVA